MGRGRRAAGNYPNPVILVQAVMRIRLGRGVLGRGVLARWPGIEVRREYSRDTDIVTTPAGNRLIVHFFTGILEHFPEIEAFQVVQESLESMKVRIVPRKSYQPETSVQITKALIEKGATEIRIEIELVDDIPTAPSGKRRFVVSKLSAFVDPPRRHRAGSDNRSDMKIIYFLPVFHHPKGSWSTGSTSSSRGLGGSAVTVVTSVYDKSDRGQANNFKLARMSDVRVINLRFLTRTE